MVSPWVAVLMIVVGIVWFYLCCYSAWKFRNYVDLHLWYDVFRPMIWGICPILIGSAMLIWG